MKRGLHTNIACLALALLSCNSFLVGAQPDTISIPDSVDGKWITNQAVPGYVVQYTRAFRERLLADPYRPAYHFCLPEDRGYPGDPNGAFYYKGKYHLMYLYNREGSGFSWGHVSSTDLLHWRHHRDALGPGDGDVGVFSGGAFVDDDGTALLSYWMLWGAKGIGLAKSTDDQFENWEKFSSNPVIRSTEWGITEMKDKSGRDIHVGSADPSNIWKKDGRYYMVTGNLLVLNKYGRKPDSPPEEQGDRLYLFSSEDLENWEYMHRFYESDRKWTDISEDNMCPSFLPLPSTPDGGVASGKHLLVFISHNKGCQYYIGDYKNDLFHPFNHGRMTWKDHSYFAPECLIDGRGRHLLWTWIFDERPDDVSKASGWTGTYGLPRSLWLGEDETLRMRPVKELEQLRLNEKRVSDLTIGAGNEVKLKELTYDLMELEVSIVPGKASQFGVKVCMSEDGREETLIYYDQEDQKLKVDLGKSGLGYGSKIIEEAPLKLEKDEPLVLRIYIDRSIVEVFANDKQAISRRIYPTLGGKGVSLFSNGGEVSVKDMKIWELTPSNPY
jgi:beta-fructofuranosidase